MPDAMRDSQLGISIRFIRQWNPEWVKLPTLADVELIRRAMRQRAEIEVLEVLHELPSPPEAQPHV